MKRILALIAVLMMGVCALCGCNAEEEQLRESQRELDKETERVEELQREYDDLKQQISDYHRAYDALTN